jgi:hypothetical protein
MRDILVHRPARLLAQASDPLRARPIKLLGRPLQQEPRLVRGQCPAHQESLRLVAQVLRQEAQLRE